MVTTAKPPTEDHPLITDVGRDVLQIRPTIAGTIGDAVLMLGHPLLDAVQGIGATQSLIRDLEEKSWPLCWRR